MPAAEVSLGPDARSPGAARRFLASTLMAWKRPEYNEEAALVLSELVTNATLHAKTEITVQIEMQVDCLRLAVTDGSPRQPAVRHYSQQSTTGRGLALVSAMARRWGIEPHPDGTKTVWAEVGGEPARRQPVETTIELRVLPGLGEAGPTSPSGQDETSACRRAA